jgi:hypothetical protein
VRAEWMGQAERGRARRGAGGPPALRVVEAEELANLLVV